MKKITIKIAFWSAILVFFVAIPVSAQLEPYTPLVNLQGTETTTLESYLPFIFRFSMGIAAGMAFVMITFGGIMYATSDAISGKSQGKEYVENAVWGLLLVIGAYVILNTINPEILNFKLLIPKPEIKNVVVVQESKGKLPGYNLTEEQVKMNDAMVKNLWNPYRVGVNNNGKACVNGETSGCTNVVGMPDEAFRGVVEVKKLCGNSCEVTITGGTEGGHTTHGPGKPTLDLRKNAQIDAFIRQNAFGAPTKNSKGDLSYVVKINGRGVIFTDEMSAKADHWHVNF